MCKRGWRGWQASWVRGLDFFLRVSNFFWGGSSFFCVSQFFCRASWRPSNFLWFWSFWFGVGQIFLGVVQIFSHWSNLFLCLSWLESSLNLLIFAWRSKNYLKIQTTLSKQTLFYALLFLAWCRKRKIDIHDIYMVYFIFFVFKEYLLP